LCRAGLGSSVPDCLLVTQATLCMNGTVMIDTITAMENTIITSLNRHGKRFVQCLVFSKIDIALYLLLNSCERIVIWILTQLSPPRVLIAVVFWHSQEENCHQIKITGTIVHGDILINNKTFFRPNRISGEHGPVDDQWIAGFR
jgi:hypothetical protein